MNAGLYIGIGLVVVGLIGKTYFALVRLSEVIEVFTPDLVESRFTLSWSPDPEVRKLEQESYYDEVFYGPDSEGGEYVPAS